MYPQRLPTNRGNAYVGPAMLDSKVLNQNGITPNWDCKPSGGEKQPVPDGPAGRTGLPRPEAHPVPGAQDEVPAGAAGRLQEGP